MHLLAEPHVLTSLDGHIVICPNYYTGTTVPFQIAVFASGNEAGVTLYEGSLEDCAAHFYSLTCIMANKNGSGPILRLDYWHKRTEALRRDVVCARGIQKIIASVQEVKNK